MSPPVTHSIAPPLILLVLISAASLTFATDFRNLGPEGGCIFDLTIGSLPANPETLYCAAINGGIYYYPVEQSWATTNWTPLREEISFHALELFRDKDGNRVLLGGTLRSGLYRTDQSTLVDANFNPVSGAGLDADISFRSISGYRLSDGGCDTVFAICDFYQQANIGPLGNGVYVSYNGGLDWTTYGVVTGNFPDGCWTKVYADAGTRGTAYALCSSLLDYTGIWQTTDAGQNWTRMNAQSTDPHFPELHGLFDETTDVVSLYQSPNRDDTLYFCSRRQNRTRNIQYANFWGFDPDRERDETGTSIIGMIDLNQDPDAWTPLADFPTWLPFNGEIYVHDTDVAGADTVWVSVNNGGVWMGVGTIPSTMTWSQKVTNLYTWYPRSFIHDFGRLDGSGASYDTLFFGTWIAGVWASSNASGTWRELNLGMKNSDNRSFCLDASATPYKIYTGTWSHGIQKTTDYGANWTFWGEETSVPRKARFNRQFPSLIINPFATDEELLAGVESHAYVYRESASWFIPGGLYRCNATTLRDATNGSIPKNVTVTCIDTVIADRDAIYAGTGSLPTIYNPQVPDRLKNPLYKVIGSPGLGDPPYDFELVRPPIPYNLGILSVLIDRADPAREKVFLGLGSLWLMDHGAIIYGPEGGIWQTIIEPHFYPDLKNTCFTQLKKHPASNDTIFASCRGFDFLTWGAMAQPQWGCLLQIYRDPGGNWHYWDISPPISEVGGPFRDNAMLGFDVRQRTVGQDTRMELIAATFNNHNIPLGSGNFQLELHLSIGVRETTGTPTYPWNWFSDVEPELVANQDISPSVWDVKFAVDADSVYVISNHSIIRYDISGLSWP